MIVIYKKNTKCFYFAFIAILSFCFSSCSSDDEKEPIQTDPTALYYEKIQGIWELVSQRNRAETNEYKTNNNFTKTLIFQNDRKFTRIVVDSSYGKENKSEYSNYYKIEKEKYGSVAIVRG